MNTNKINSPLLGYNTNVRHAGHLFHIQTEDSGRDHPHVITHLFTEGTILSTKKTSYDENLEKDNCDEIVRQLMKNQHKAMFVELRNGTHDEIAEQILGKSLDHTSQTIPQKKENKTGDGFKIQGNDTHASSLSEAVVPPQSSDHIISKSYSIFETPDNNGTLGDSLISDKSLDEVILSYLTDEID